MCGLRLGFVALILQGNGKGYRRSALGPVMFGVLANIVSSIAVVLFGGFSLEGSEKWFYDGCFIGAESVKDTLYQQTSYKASLQPQC